MFFRKKQKKVDIAAETVPTRAEEGYFVSFHCVYDTLRDCWFINDELGIRKKFFDDLVIVDFPGYTGGSWEKYFYRKPVTERSALRADFSKPDENGITRVSITVQWRDNGDEGFGMDDDHPEIRLISYLDKYGNYTGPFELCDMEF